MSLSIRSRALGAMLSLGFCTLLGAPAAHAANSDACAGGGFTLVLPNGASVSGSTKTKIDRRNLPSHGTLRVRGTYIDFDLDVSTFAVYNYTLKATNNPLDITGGVTTVLFTRKEPNLGTQTLEKDDLEVELGSGDLVLLRKGRSVKMKIQAKDCAQGGIFQMEPELDAGGTIDITHTLGPAVFYFTNPYTSKINFGNANLLRGKDSPQVAAKLVQGERETVWRVTSGGRMGGVLGEDAVENSPPATSCTQDCQAQNRVQGRYDVPDPVYENDGGGIGGGGDD
jgi:hypothetical protein